MLLTGTTIALAIVSHAASALSLYGRNLSDADDSDQWPPSE